jgi:hypothetical protein
MKIEKFTKENLKSLRLDIQSELQGIAERYGLKVLVGNASFSPSNVTYKLELTVEGSSKERDSFVLHAPLIGLSADDLDKQISIVGKKYTIKGYLPRRQKFPILVETEAGKMVCLPLDVVLNAVKKVTLSVEQIQK